MLYCTTPNATTGVSPAELLFGQKIRTEIPNLQQYSADDVEVCNYDSEKKGKGKLYTDKKRGAVESNIEVGDKILVKQDRENKFSTKFNPNPYTVVEKLGNTVGIKSQTGSRYRRNVTSVKKFHEKAEGSSSNDTVSNAERGQVLLGNNDDFVVAGGTDPIDPGSMLCRSPTESIVEKGSFDPGPGACQSLTEPVVEPTQPVRTRRLPAKY